MLGKKAKIIIKDYDGNAFECTINYIRHVKFHYIIGFCLPDGRNILRAFPRETITEAFEKGSSEISYGYRIKTF